MLEKKQYNIILEPKHDLCFDRKRPSFGWLVVQNRGHSGSRIIYIIIMIYVIQTVAVLWLYVASFDRSQNTSTFRTNHHGSPSSLWKIQVGKSFLVYTKKTIPSLRSLFLGIPSLGTGLHTKRKSYTQWLIRLRRFQDRLH